LLGDRQFATDKFAMTTAGDGQRAAEQPKHVEHAVDSVVRRCVESTVHSRRQRLRRGTGRRHQS
jgi:hypothetical protein